MLVDTHTHVYHRRFHGEEDAAIARAKDAGVTHLFLSAIDVPSIHQALALCERHEGVYAMTALHPTETKEATDADFAAVVDFCSHPKVVAVGESGLDYYWDRSFNAIQHDFFRRHIRLALAEDLPLILHNRNATDDLVRILREERAASDHPERMRGIFHCFGGPAAAAEDAAELGFLVGLGGTLTFKNAGVAEAVADVPLSQIVLETDAPFLAPVPFRGKRNEPAYVTYVAEKLAEVKGVPLETVAEVTTANALRLFGVAP